MGDFKYEPVLLHALSPSLTMRPSDKKTSLSAWSIRNSTLCFSIIKILRQTQNDNEIELFEQPHPSHKSPAVTMKFLRDVLNKLALSAPTRGKGITFLYQASPTWGKALHFCFKHSPPGERLYISV